MAAAFKALILAALIGALLAHARAGEPGITPIVKVPVPALDGRVTLDGYLVRPDDQASHPALVLLHGCGGLLTKRGLPEARLTAWSAQLAGRGYVVLMLDSFTPREQGQMCSQQGFRLSVFRDRPSDAYSALRWLQSQPFVRPDRVGVMGWSEGGGVVLMSIGARSLGRPDTLPDGDFRAAVAFYPASCDERKLGGLLGASPAWSSTIPLLVLVGDGDVWTPAGPCRALLDGARSRGTPAEMHIYPGAFHDFDWPNIPVRERPEFITKSGTVPITGTNPDARADALERVPAFLATYLGK